MCSRKLICAALLLLSLPAIAATGTSAPKEWQLAGEGDIGKLYVKTSSIEKQGDGVSALYRMDFASPQRNTRGGKNYLSTDIQATVFCKPSTIVRTELTAYSEAGGKGEVVGGFKRSVLEAQLEAIHSGGSDEDLWRFLCVKKTPGKK